MQKESERGWHMQTAIFYAVHGFKYPTYRLKPE